MSQRAHDGCGIGRRADAGGDGDALAAYGGELGDVGGGDAADGAVGDAGECWIGEDGGEVGWAGDGLVGAGGAVEHGADAEDARAGLDGDPGEFERGRGGTDLELASREGSGIADGEVVLAEVDAVGLGGEGDIHAVVDDEASMVLAGDVPSTPGQGEEFGVGERLLSDLDLFGAGVEGGTEDVLPRVGRAEGLGEEESDVGLDDGISGVEAH